MYKTNPINKFASTDLASSYYGSTCATNYVSGPGKLDGLAELEMRQEAVLLRLQCLKQQLDKLQNNKCPTDQSMPSMAVVGAAAQSSPVKQPAGVKQAVVEHILTAIQGHLDDISSLHFNSQIQIGTVHDLVIAANPDRPPYSLVLLRKLLKNVGFPVYCANHLHSSVKKVGETLQKTFTESPEGDRSKHSLAFTLHWKDVSSPSLMVNPLHQTPISGEANIIRYVSRLFPLSSPYNYEATGTFTLITETDNLLDQLTNQMICGNNKERQAVLRLLNGRLGRASWLMGDKCSIVDVMAWSAVRQTGSEVGAPANVSKWYKAVSNLAGLESSVPQENNIVSSKNEKNQTISKNAGKISNGHMDRKGLEQLLKKLNMKFQVQDHEEVFTVEALMKNVSLMPGLHMKNLFLKDKKKNLYLLSARHNAEVKLNEVGKQMGVKELRFGDESVMFDVLGVKQGCVTAYALINDKNHQVKFLLDSEALDERHEYINFHPLSNAATLGISPANLKKFLSHTGHEPTLLTFK
ncbi:aminoacyl tRNA synthase complex-interacting multifunctional protein 2-like isoform X5 [Macrobrachium nipponense]|uniref:aminoacyl tRNA synthase complex-interacting multifunctional protein 2-like isoform X5 n=1 Tax=Macrobrachium nipponense TaxID=159736 RepID=UPI0030C8A4A5